MDAYKETTKHFKKLSELAAFSKEIISSTYEENKPEVLSKVKDAYDDYIFDDDEEEADKLADEIFNGIVTVSMNAPDEEEGKGKYAKARYLLLSLPTKDNRTEEERIRDTFSRRNQPSGTEEQRMGEYWEFIRAMDDPNMSADDIKVVTTKEGMFNRISQFLNDTNSSFANFIVFNGHGAGDRNTRGAGLCLDEEEQNLPLDGVIREIETKSKDLRLGVVFIIFVQCYAHLHSPIDDITVVYFTSVNKPKTKSMKRQGIYTHRELTKWASVKRNVAQGAEYLLLIAPMIGHNGISSAMDTKIQQWQYKNFIAEVGGDISTQQVVVTKWGHMQCAIIEFLRYGNSQKVIIFNGCGNRDGLLLYERNAIEVIELDKVVREVAKLVKNLGLIQEVKLLFAQCYGHLYTDDAIGGVDNFKVISLTQIDKPKVMNLMRIDKLTQEVVDSTLVGLCELVRHLRDSANN